jgi:riboflavin synthase
MMFTGIIQEVGKVVSVEPVGDGLQIGVQAVHLGREIKVDDSVAVNGVCQTVVEANGSQFKVEAVEETLRKTTLGGLRIGSPVNLELPLRLSDRLGGHLVQGHVDGVGVVKSIRKKESSWLVSIELPREFLKYVIPVGSISIDGVSLTVASVAGSLITVSIIPHTWAHTLFSSYAVTTRVNIELDVIGKYVERFLLEPSAKPESGSITSERLREWGYEA